MNLESFYKDKNILITGHTGFKGSWLCLYLKHLGANVFGYSLPPTKKSLFQNLRIEKDICKSLYSDIRDAKKIKGFVKDIDPYIVFHLAAQPIVLESYDKPLETFEINAMGTANLLNAVKVVKSIKGVVNITTDKCYLNLDNNFEFQENDRLGGNDPYSASKACAELISYCFYKSYFSHIKIGSATARAGNIIGGGDFSKNRIIPDVIRAAETNAIIKVRNPNATRPWLFVLDALSGYLTLGKVIAEQENSEHFSYNFAPQEDQSITVLSLAQQIIDRIGKGTIEVIHKNDKYESPHLKLNPNKAFKDLQWATVLNQDESINWTIDWYKSYLEKGVSKIKDLTLEQIYTFLSRIR